jgi:hypothetical protein
MSVTSNPYITFNISSANTGSFTVNGGWSHNTSIAGHSGPIVNPGAITVAGAMTSGLNSSMLGSYNVNSCQNGLSIPIGNNVRLTISPDGQIEWSGPASKAAEHFLTALGHVIDCSTSGKRALAKSYRLAIERCLRQAKRMSHEDFIVMLEKEVATRQSKAVWMTLCEDEAVDE